MSTAKTPVQSLYLGNRSDIALVYTFSNGSKAMLYEAISGTQWYYAVSTDSGATWTDNGIISGSPLAGNTRAIIMENDRLYWLVPESGSVSCYVASWTPSSNVFGVALRTSIGVMPVGVIVPEEVSITFDGTNFYVACIANWGSLKTVVVAFLDWHGVLGRFVDLGLRSVNLHEVRLRGGALSGGYRSLYLSMIDNGTNAFYVLPLLYQVSTATFIFTTAAVETAFTAAVTDHDTAMESDGTVSILTLQSGSLFVQRRTSAKHYSTPVSLASSVESAASIRLSINASTGDAVVFYGTTVNQPNGEIYVARRTGGVWYTGALFAGGDSAGYGPIAQSRTLGDTALDVAYFVGTSTVSQDYQSAILTGAPTVPTIHAPIGTISTVTPLIQWQYNNPSSGNPQGAFQIQVVRVSDSAVMLDTGTKSGADMAYLYTPATDGALDLSFTVPYHVRVRTQDSLSSTWGPWSAYSTFTPLRAANVAIASVTSNAVTDTSSPTTLPQATFSAHVTYSQDDGDNAVSYTMRLYDTDNATVLATRITTPLTPIATNFDTDDWTVPVLQNGHTYHLSISVTDAVSGVITEATRWELDTSWTPPAAPAGLFLTNYDDEGYVQLQWTNDVSYVATSVQWRSRSKGGRTSDWMDIGDGGLYTSMSLFPPPGFMYDYRVSGVSANGLQSAWSTETGFILGFRANKYGVWLNRLSDPLGEKMAVGAPNDNWDVTEEQLMVDVQEWGGQGDSLATQTFGRLAYLVNVNHQWMVEERYTLQDGALAFGEDDIAIIEAMARDHAPLLYRDPRGRLYFVQLINFKPKMLDAFNFVISFETHQTRYLGGYPWIAS